MTIAVDAMGGDHGPEVTVPAAMQVLEGNSQLHLILVGDQDIIQPLLKKHRLANNERLTIKHASQRVEMDESPSNALRNKKDSSMRVAINLVKEGLADACVSAGNTGALMATARFVLKTLPGIDRPAIVSAFPTQDGTKNVRMLDLGANVDSTPEHLFQFAIMGSVLASAVDNITTPSVCLLNIGEEDIKGNELVKETAKLLENYSAINYAGFIEGNRLFSGEIDVVVCDGFVGNVALKSCEGISSFIGKIIKEEFKRNWLTKLMGLVALPVMKSVIKRIEPDRYNGATFIGLQGIVIKSHGAAKTSAFAHAITAAMLQVEKNIPARVSSQVEQLLKLSSRNT